MAHLRQGGELELDVKMSADTETVTLDLDGPDVDSGGLKERQNTSDFAPTFGT